MTDATAIETTEAEATAPEAILGPIPEPGSDVPPDLSADKLRRIAEANEEVERKHDDWQEAKDLASERKSSYDLAVKYLSKLIHSLTAKPEEEVMPLFDRPKPAPAVEDTSWRLVSVDDLDLPSAVILKLKDGYLTTVGHIADWTAKGNLLTDLDGIGPAKAELIEEALVAFHAGRSAGPGRVTPKEGFLGTSDVDAELAAGCAEVEAARLDAAIATDLAGPDAGEKAWDAKRRALDLTHLDILHSVREALERSGITTIDRLESRLFGEFERIDDIHGISAEAADQIDRALTLFNESFWDDIETGLSAPSPDGRPSDVIAAIPPRSPEDEPVEVAACNLCNGHRRLTVHPCPGCGHKKYRLERISADAARMLAEPIDPPTPKRARKPRPEKATA